ncbi:hypothetical protein [Actinocrispum wychmicini]|uniref:Uncharacterized protein n=1 Tax=Actinocrispum wychmicini TaxID=1213861 RepID=A0A4R2JC19_9PSEU|nr:hypothetical protein [Actinocrispum wychmicini]TCO54278.1 hypothetical protein EV192_109258 [Actinocrispum wychmicini]
MNVIEVAVTPGQAKGGGRAHGVNGGGVARKWAVGPAEMAGVARRSVGAAMGRVAVIEVAAPPQEAVVAVGRVALIEVAGVAGQVARWRVAVTDLVVVPGWVPMGEGVMA